MKTLFTSFLLLGLFMASHAQAGVMTFGVFSQNSTAATSGVGIATGQGHTASVLGGLTAGDLAGLDVLWVLNSSNFSHPSVLTANSAAVASFVAGGGVFMYHDRRVTGAETVLPGGGAFTITRAFGAGSTDIDVLDSSTLVTNGPGGLINDSTLDGGDSSNHGFSVSGSLPGGSTQILSRPIATEIVDFRYSFGSGEVYYSTIPLDFYLSRFTPQPNFAGIYAPNVVAYAADLAMSNTVPEPTSFAVFGLGFLVAGARRRRS